MFKISLYLFFITNFIFASQFDINKISDSAKKIKLNSLTKLLKNKYPKMYKKINKIQASIDSTVTSGDVVYLFTSESVPIDIVKNFIIEGSILNYYHNTKVVIVFQGITSSNVEKQYDNLRKELETFSSSNIFITNLNRVIDPKVFKDLNIKEVPVLAYGKHNGDTYPSSSNILYIQRGDYALRTLFEELIEKGKIYEKYYNSIISTK